MTISQPKRQTALALTALAFVLLAACGKPAASEPAGVSVVEPPPTKATPMLAERPTDAVAPVTVELYHDVVCPWCRIGHAHLDNAIAEFGGPVEIVYKPYLLNPTAPDDPKPLKAYLAGKYGAGKVDGMFARVTQVGRKAGLTFNFNDDSTVVASVKAHALLDWAPQAKRAELLGHLHDAYFEANANIGSPVVLAGLAAKAGLDATAAKTAVSDAARLQRIRSEATSARGIRGVPHFRIAGQSLHGAQPAAALLKALRQGKR